MIILATISINAVLGENGIIKRAESARQHQLNAEASDNEALDELDKYFANAMAGEGNGNSGNQEPLGISYRIEDIDVSGKAVILSYAGAYEEYAKQILNGITETGEARENILEQMLIEADKYHGYTAEEGMEVTDFVEYMKNDYGDYGFAEGEEPTTLEELRIWVKTNWDESYETVDEMLISWGSVKPEGYQGANVASTAKNGTHEVVGIENEFIATRNGTYTVKAIAEDGRQAEIEVNITGIEEEKFSTIYETTTTYTEGELTAKIPAGFAVGISEGINTIEGGLVITDAVDSQGYSIGNEYVWIPVESDETFIRESFGSSTLSSKYTEPFNYTSGGTTYTGYATEEQEYNTMRTQVIANHGFYIGRYESGVDTATLRSNPTEGAQQVVIKRGTAPYNYVPWGASMSDINSDVTVESNNGTEVQTKGAVYLSQNMYNGKTQANSVTSTLIYGVQWDAMCRFIEDYTRTTPGKDNVDLTGRIGGDNSKNIYDLAGNCFEWTMEANTRAPRVGRGGYFNYSHPVSYRYDGSPTNRNDGPSFRSTLYVK